MPQWRKLHVKATESLDINDMPDDFTRLLWIMLPLGLDREGRGLDNPAWVKAKIMPLRLDVTPQIVEEAMSWYARRGMIKRYEVDGRRYFYVPTFVKYQGNTEREAESNFPPPPDLAQAQVESKSGVGQDLGTDDSSSDSDAESESEEKEESPARDYLDDVFTGVGGLQPGVSDPSQERERWYKYRNQALKIYHELTDLYPDTKVGKPAIVNLARAPDFDLQKWRRSIESCRLNGVNPANIACIIDTYKAGGDYHAMREQQYGRNGNSQDDSVTTTQDGKKTRVVK